MNESSENAVGQILASVWGEGCRAAGTGLDRSANPYPIDGADWNEWLRGFQAWEDAPKVVINLPDA